MPLVISVAQFLLKHLGLDLLLLSHVASDNLSEVINLEIAARFATRIGGDRCGGNR